MRGCLDGSGGPIDPNYPAKAGDPQGNPQIKIYSGYIACRDAYLLAGR